MQRLRFLHLVRAGDWWLYHLLPLLAVAYASIAFFAVPPGLALTALLRLLLSIVCIAAYSHLVNDLADAEQDAAAGKPDRWRAVPAWQKAALSLALLLCGFAVWVGAGLSALSVVLLAVIAGLQPVYALRPVRLKERGAWGLAADTLHTHALPTLYCASLFADLAGAPAWQPFPLAATTWAFLVGVRGILYHQRTDEAADRRAGVKTFVTTHGSERAAGLARRLVFPAELAALGVLGLTLLPTAPVVVVGLGVYGALIQLLRWAGVGQGSLADPAPAEKGAYVPLLAFYRSWPGVAFALLLAWRDPAFLLVPLLHLAVFAPLLLREADDLWDLLLWYARAPVLVARRVARGR